MKPFPIPVVALGPGTQSEDESLDYVSMPKDMNTYRPPVLPEPEEIAGRAKARAALGCVLAMLDAAAEGRPGGQVSLLDLPAEDRNLINQVMGEGEASALLRTEGSALEQRIQESVFAGVWRIMSFNDGALRLREADGRIAVDGFEDQRYRELIDEAVKPWTYMKFPYLRALGPEAGWYRVGPLARLQNCDHIPTPRAEARRQAFIAAHGGRPVHAVLATHWARMIELLHGVEVIAQVLDDPVILGGPLQATGERQRSGVGIIEAPRGTLIHEYEVGDDELVTSCNLIVSTTHNNQAMNEAVRSVALQYLDGQTITEPLLNHLEVAIRAYDPCLSCATHALGQMPLSVTLRGSDGEVLDHVLRSSTGETQRGATPHPMERAQ